MDVRKLIHDKNITELEKSILVFLIENQSKIKGMGIREVAQANYTSTSSVIRLAKKLGYQGYTDMLYNLSINDEKTLTPSVESYTPLKNILLSNEIDHFRVLFENTHDRIFIYATGFSGIIGNYINKKLLVRGNNVIFVDGSDSVAVFERQVNMIGSFLVISKSGDTPLMLEKSMIVKESGIPIYAITSNKNSKLLEIADHSIVIEGYEITNDKNENPDLFFAECLIIFEHILTTIK